MRELLSNYNPLIGEKLGTLQKSCRNLLSEEDIRLVEKAFTIAIQNGTPPETSSDVTPVLLPEQEVTTLPTLSHRKSAWDAPL